ncbi:MAG: MBL fold metallo-hydrolase [Pseudomonadota bacterium]
MAPDIPFVRDPDVAYGRVERISPLVRRVVAPNPSPFTYTGTGTFIVGQGAVAVIDPGPLLDDHVAALLAALEGERVSHILITHTHADHSPAAAPLKAATGAPTFGFGPHGSGRPEPAVRVEEDGDRSFTPDHAIRNGAVIEGAGWCLEALHTPGHTSNHLCFALAEEATLFSGDHVMGWSTSVISPPDGDMQAYLRALESLLGRDDALYRPTHGPAITQPKRHVAALIAHRQKREAAIAAALADGLRAIPEMVARIYREVPVHLHPAAGRTVLAHLIHMVETRRADCDGAPAIDGVFTPPR